MCALQLMMSSSDGLSSFRILSVNSGSLQLAVSSNVYIGSQSF